MNLRFEKNTIRIRILQSEALLLLDEKPLFEKFPFSDSVDPIAVQVQTHNSDFQFEQSHLGLRLQVPKGLLQKTVGEASKDPVCRLQANIHGLSTEIIFEVDVFKKREGEKS